VLVAGADRRICRRISPAASGHSVEIHEAGLLTGGGMRSHSEVLPARRARRRGRRIEAMEPIRPNRKIDDIRWR
jgi:hypothetical protein